MEKSKMHLTAEHAENAEKIYLINQKTLIIHDGSDARGP